VWLTCRRLTALRRRRPGSIRRQSAHPIQEKAGQSRDPEAACRLRRVHCPARPDRQTRPGRVRPVGQVGLSVSMALAALAPSIPHPAL
jgi:hypothetical protein